jgi:hypothetical protein
MQTEQVSLATPTFSTADGTISVLVRNTGTSALTISSVTVNNAAATFNGTATTATISANGQAIFVVTPGASTPIVLGNNYQIKFITSKNNPFSTSAVAV